MLKLTNVQFSSTGRIISDFFQYDESTNRGIRTHNRLGKIFADWFGSGTIKVYIDDKKYYLNKNSCYKLFEYEPTYNLFKNKPLFVGQIQSIFEEMHTGKPLIHGFAVGFKNRHETQMAQIMQWVNDNKSLLGQKAYQEAMGTIKFFQYLNTKAGLSSILNHQQIGCFIFDGPNFEIRDGIYFHYHFSKKESKNALNSLFSQFILSLNQLKTDKQKTQFFKELDGLCIEAKTSNAFVYAASIESNPEVELEPFYNLIEKYRLEAHEALRGQVITIELLAQHINDKHDGEKCISDAYLCPEGVISLESSRTFLEFAEVDLV